MNIPTDTYPVADKDGNYRYEATVPIGKLESTFVQHFDDSGIQLDSRVLHIYGVPANKELPKTVASLGDIPAQAVKKLCVLDNLVLNGFQ